MQLPREIALIQVFTTQEAVLLISFTFRISFFFSSPMIVQPLSMFDWRARVINDRAFIERKNAASVLHKSPRVSISSLENEEPWLMFWNKSTAPTYFHIIWMDAQSRVKFHEVWTTREIEH